MTSIRERSNRTTCRPLPRVQIGTVAAALVLLLAACGSGDDVATADGAATESETATTTELAESEDESQPETTEAAAEETTEETTAPTGSEAPCGQVVSQEEFETLINKSVEFTGGPTNCLVIYADDSVGSMSVFSGNRAVDVSNELIAKFTEQIQSAPDSGIVLDDGRGYVVLDGTVGVLGESGNFYQVVIPDNAGVESLDVVVQNIADLLLTR